MHTLWSRIWLSLCDFMHKDQSFIFVNHSILVKVAVPIRGMLGTRWAPCTHMKVLLEQNDWAPVTVEFVVIENSHTCISKLNSQRKFFLSFVENFFSPLPQTQHNSYTSSSSLQVHKSYAPHCKWRKTYVHESWTKFAHLQISMWIHVMRVAHL